MHHEILLALSGFPGDVFIKHKQDGFHELIPDIPLIHPSEVNIVNKIVSLGNYYSSLQDFIKQQTSAVIMLKSTHLPSDDNSSPDPNPGLYVRALAFGLNEILEDYRHRIVEVEKECIKDPHLPLSHIQHRFQEYQFLLPSLRSTITDISQNKIKGCNILTLLYDKTACGIPIVKSVYERLLYNCHGVLYKQLGLWMIHGELKDDGREFFIKEKTRDETDRVEVKVQ
jgi:gamma-tubulin complex component 4